MKSTKEQKTPLNPEALVLERLVGITRIIRKGNDPAQAEIAAKYERTFARDLEVITKQAA